MIASAALAVSFCSLGLSVYFWRRSFRPIVTAVVKTHAAGSELIAYDLVVLNSGSLPAKDIRIMANDTSLAAAFGEDATAENKERWLACFKNEIAVLQNNDRVSCSFGTTKKGDSGFWKTSAQIPITVTYKGWFGRSFTDAFSIRIADSNSFTGYSWGQPS